MLTENQASDALRAVQAVSQEFHGFDATDCEELSKSMTVIRFGAGDHIVSKGEPASWFGVLLEGDVEARIGPGLTFELNVGTFIGDMSLFEPNVGRGADIFAASDGLIGLFTFDGLEEFMEINPLLGLKMYRAVGYSTVTKLLRQRGRTLRSTPSLTGTSAASEQADALGALLALRLDQPVFSIFDTDDLKQLVAHAQLQHFRAGDTLLHRGQVPQPL
eukprot:18362-Prymnesium_polylepis.1